MANPKNTKPNALASTKATKANEPMDVDTTVENEEVEAEAVVPLEDIVLRFDRGSIRIGDVKTETVGEGKERTLIAYPTDEQVRVVDLSKAREATIARIKDATQRFELRKSFVADVLASKISYEKFKLRRLDFNMQLTDRGLLAINGTGTRRNAIFTKAQAMKLVEAFDEFKTLVASMKD